MAKPLYYYTGEAFSMLPARRRYHAQIGTCQLAMNLTETDKLFEGVLANITQLHELTKRIGHPPVCAACGELIVPFPADDTKVD